jgi:hypothetical protein
MKNKIENLLIKFNPMLKNLMFITFVVLSLITGFSVGKKYNEEFSPKEPTIEMIKWRRDEVNLALDESNRLIVIDKQTGNYTVYQDSIGISIFKLYARNIWTDFNKK